MYRRVENNARLLEGSYNTLINFCPAERDRLEKLAERLKEALRYGFARSEKRNFTLKVKQWMKARGMKTDETLNYGKAYEEVINYKGPSNPLYREFDRLAFVDIPKEEKSQENELKAQFEQIKKCVQVLMKNNLKVLVAKILV